MKAGKTRSRPRKPSVANRSQKVHQLNQAQIEVTVTISDGRVFKNRLPSAKIPVALPDDRPFTFSAVAQYTDKMGKPYGLVSQPLTGTSDVSS